MNTVKPQWMAPLLGCCQGEIFAQGQYYKINLKRILPGTAVAVGDRWVAVGETMRNLDESLEILANERHDYPKYRYRIKAPETLGFSKGYLDLAELDFPGGMLLRSPLMMSIAGIPVSCAADD